MLYGKAEKKYKLFLFICNRIREKPILWEQIIKNIDYQNKHHDIHKYYKDEISSIVSKGMEHTLKILEDKTDYSHDIRQIFPCWDIISEKERMDILNPVK